MILSEKKQYYCVKDIDGMRHYLSLASFRFNGVEDGDKFDFPGTSTKEDLQYFLDNFVSKTLLEGSKIISITTTRTLNEE